MRHLTGALPKLLCAATLLFGVALRLPAQVAWPSQPIKLVVPYAAGGTTDLIARRLGERMTRELGQPVVVDNRPGAGTNIGAGFVATAKPDGYTVLFGSVFQVLNPVFGPEPSFDVFTALEPISLVAITPFVLAANPKTPFNTGSELVAAAKAAPGKLSVSHAQLDLSLELLSSKAGIQLLLVPYKGGAPATTDAISGQVDMVYALVPVLLPQIQAGKLKPLAVTSAQRFDGLPNVPSFTESGVPFDMSMWYGIFTPAGTPKAVIERLSLATQKIMKSKEMMSAVHGLGATPVDSSPEEFRAQLRSETAHWQGIAKAMPKLVQR